MVKCKEFNRMSLISNKKPKGLVNYWPGYGLLTDVGGGFDITQYLCPSPQFTSDRFGHSQGAFNFQNPSLDASSECYAVLPPASYFASSFSILAWVKLYSRQNWQRIFETINTDSSERVTFGFKEDTGSLNLFTGTESFFLLNCFIYFI